MLECMTPRELSGGDSVRFPLIPTDKALTQSKGLVFTIFENSNLFYESTE